MKKDEKQRLFEVMSRLDKTFKHILNEESSELNEVNAIMPLVNNHISEESNLDIDSRENLEYFLSLNNDDVYWKWINDKIDDNGAIELMRDIDGTSYDPNINYKEKYSNS